MEYELDFVTNRAKRDTQVIFALTTAIVGCSSLGAGVVIIITGWVTHVYRKLSCVPEVVTSVIQALKDCLAAMTAERDQLRRTVH